ncbi:ferritin [Lentisphaerota bacterium ZTH]|nr:ferritin [Lentisphaerota bacterium]WET06298.1 ferritin [Lentisphaerota bacterium ZTH]
MLSKELEKALNEQINFELYSSYLYMAMCGALQSMNFEGASNWMKVQAMEEMTHADKMFNFVFERDGKVMLDKIDCPPSEWPSMLAVYEDVYKHEKIVTARISNLMELALSEKDHATSSFLQWFITEQIEEESNAKTIIDKLKMANNAPHMLLMMDMELGKRQFTMPAASEQA